MQVSGKNLLNVCKLLFTLGKEEDNDELFKEESIAGNKFSHFNTITNTRLSSNTILLSPQKLKRGFTTSLSLSFRASGIGTAVGRALTGARDYGLWAGHHQAAGQLPLPQGADGKQ